MAKKKTPSLYYWEDIYYGKDVLFDLFCEADAKEACNSELAICFSEHLWDILNSMDAQTFRDVYGSKIVEEEVENADYGEMEEAYEERTRKYHKKISAKKLVELIETCGHGSILDDYRRPIEEVEKERVFLEKESLKEFEVESTPEFPCFNGNL